MGRMKEIDIVLRSTEEHLGEIDHKLDSLLHLMSDMVKMEANIEKLEGVIQDRLANLDLQHSRIANMLSESESESLRSEKLTDRLIEMALVNRGQAAEAVTHRAQSRLENDFSNPQSWAGEIDDDEGIWPPPNCDVMESRG